MQDTADIPIYMIPAADEEFRKMHSAGVLEKFEHATTWCSLAFLVIKCSYLKNAETYSQ